jgi:hypothetical protein
MVVWNLTWFKYCSRLHYRAIRKQNRPKCSVSKKLNDRLKVTVGSSFGLEGPQQANQTTNNIAEMFLLNTNYHKTDVIN